MTYIEFLGLPGAGKTTWAKELCSMFGARRQQALMKPEIIKTVLYKLLLQEQGKIWKLVRLLGSFWEFRVANVLWEKKRIAFLFRFMAQHPELSRLVVDCAQHVTPPDWIPKDAVCCEKLIDWLFSNAVFYQAAHELANAADILIMEEGFCQQSYYLTAFYNGNFDEGRLYEYLNATPKPDFFVALLPDADECEKRLNQREKGVSSGILTPLTVQQRLEVLEHRVNVYQKIADYWEGRSVNVVRIHNETRQEVNALLTEQILSCVTP